SARTVSKDRLANDEADLIRTSARLSVARPASHRHASNGYALRRRISVLYKDEGRGFLHQR
ncbi:MAG: hypothetical protein E6447_13315, partial [Bradyrhizobium sp.]|nr:hypothetical protein [Bradyrhizobium sp.]